MSSPVITRPGARLALSTRRSGSRAPILISFSPSRSIGEYGDLVRKEDGGWMVKGVMHEG